MAKRQKQQLGLLVNEDTKDARFFRLTASVVILHSEGHNSIRNPRGEYDEVYDFKDLMVTSLGENTTLNGDPNPEPRLYGWEVRYEDVYSVDHRRAKKMAKTLDMVQRKLDKLKETRGYPQSYAEFLGRVGEAIGAQTVLRYKGKLGNGKWGYDGEEFQFWTLGDGVANVAHMERQWREKILARAPKVPHYGDLAKANGVGS